MTDLVLAILHHVLVFGLAIMLASQAAIVRTGVTPAVIPRLAGLDIGYGATAGLIVIVGLLRVYLGAKGSLYYLSNFWFFAKMASFAAIGILSIAPTMSFRRWRVALKSDPGFVPPATEVSSVQRCLIWELALIAAVVAFAATMARYTRL